MHDEHLIDDPVFESIERIGSKGDFARELVGKFETRARELVALVEAHAASGDLVALRRAAHSLKGVSASVGARVVTNLASTIEVAAVAGSVDAASAAALHSALASALEAMRGRLDARR